MTTTTALLPTSPFAPFFDTLSADYVRKEDGVILSAKLFGALGIRSVCSIMEYKDCLQEATIFLGEGGRPVALTRCIESDWCEGQQMKLCPNLFRFEGEAPEGGLQLPRMMTIEESDGTVVDEYGGEPPETRTIETVTVKHGKEEVLLFRRDRTLPVVFEGQFDIYAEKQGLEFVGAPRKKKGAALIDRVDGLMSVLRRAYHREGSNELWQEPFSLAHPESVTFVGRQIAEDMGLTLEGVRDIWIAGRVGMCFESGNLEPKAFLNLTPEVMARCYPILWEAKAKELKRKLQEENARFERKARAKELKRKQEENARFERKARACVDQKK